MSDEEFEAFVRQNRELIEKMMELQKTNASQMVQKGFDKAEETAHRVEKTVDDMNSHTREVAETAYNAFTDPVVQKHFFNMGMEFAAGMSAILMRAPLPEFMKEAAETTEKNWKQSACRNNDQCRARKKAQRVEINDDPQEPPSEPRTGSIPVTDLTVSERFR